MNKTLKTYLALLLGVIILLIYIDSSTKKPLDWSPTYSLDKKKPLDLYVFNHEANKLFQNNLTRITVTPFEYIREHKENANFLIIKKEVYSELDSQLLDKVKNGSNLFLFTEGFIKNLEDTLKLKYADIDPNISIDMNRKDSVLLTLTMSNWKQKNCSLNPALNPFAFTRLDSSTTTILGNMTAHNGLSFPNYIRVKFGQGNIYIHNQPQVFSNYALLKKNSTADYVAHIVSYIPNDKPVVWFVKNQTINPDEPVNDSTLSVIFRYPALRMTWLLFIYGLLLYILFNTKRRQRIIPVIRPLKNTTKEFVQTIGNLYFQDSDTSKIIEKKIIYFLDRIRQNYFLDTRKLDDSFVERLQSKSGKNKELISTIIGFINKFEKNKVTERKDLIFLNSKFEEFWNDEK